MPENLSGEALMLTKCAIGNLVNRYRAVLKKCNLINTFGSLAVASMLVLGGAGVAEAEKVLTDNDSITITDGETYTLGANTVTLKDSTTGTVLKSGNIKLAADQTLNMSSDEDTTINGVIGFYGTSSITGEGILNITGEKMTTGIAYGNHTVDVKELHIEVKGDAAGIYATGDNYCPAAVKDIKADIITIKSLASAVSMTGNTDETIKITEFDSLTLTGGTEGHALRNMGGKNTLEIKGNAGSTITAISEGRSALRQEAGSTTIEGGTISFIGNGTKDNYPFVLGVKGGTATITATEKLTITDNTKNETGAVFISGGQLTLDGGKNLTVNGKVQLAGGTTKFIAPITSVTASGMAIEASNSAKFDVVGGLNVTAEGSDVVRGLRAIGGSEMNIGSADADVTINVTGDSSAYDVVAVQAKETGTKMTINAKNFTVNTKYNGEGIGYGILAQNTTDSGVENPAQLDITAENINITVTDADGNLAGSAIAAMSEGQLNLTGNVTASAKNAILARGNATAKVNVGAEGKTVKLAGDINFNWDKTSGTPVDADVNVILDGDQSRWDGNSLVSWNGISEAKKADPANLEVSGLNITLSNKAVWAPTAVEEFDNKNTDGTYTGQRALAVNSLTMNDGIVAIASGVAAEVEELAGTGGEVRVENAETLGSFTAQEATGVALNVTAMDADGAVQNADTVTAEDLARLQTAVQAKGATVTASAPEGDVEGAISIDKNGNVKQAKNSLMEAALKHASVASISLDRILTNDVRKRMGDLRADANQSGVWMRWDGGKLKNSGLTNDFNTIQIGGDTKVAKNCRLGVAGSFTHGDVDFARGNGELEGFSFAAYATWMGDNGMFADVVARLGHFSTEMNVEGRSGDMDNRVASLSGEYGWRFNVCDQFFVEPQVEVAYTYVSSEDLQLGTAQYHFDDVDSLTGRAGLVFGWNLPDDRGNVYARASVLQQFMGDAKISGTNGRAHSVQETDGEDTWLEYGLGANIKLTDKTYVWADVERTEGAEIEEEWRGTVGVRFSF